MPGPRRRPEVSEETLQRPPAGRVERLAPGLRRVIAPNPSPMTHWGTNSYIVGEGDVAVIDPGPADPAHMRALLAALKKGERVSHIIVTHAHLDHSPLARPLAEATGAPVIAFGDARAGRSAVMERLARAGLAGGGEGVDSAFAPDVVVADGERIAGAGWELEVIHTPGHFGNHLSLAWGEAVFTGDHVMGWASSLVSPPDGDLAQFMESCARLAARKARIFYPGHGAPISDPAARLDWLIAHRRSRGRQIAEALAEAPDTALGLARRIYSDVPEALLPAASRNVFAHLVEMFQKNEVEAEPDLSPGARFRLIARQR
ncbi:Glyoxylase, beta-lactamase superfamily II [Meinhardsimonia xiamenensis]|uniref:Glyoxylase, beta-lactamase superfamily II n=1 Tax=Meinhardsimonia xiamenensis TaxID=990712 RepID=A0A1G9FC53_9RHOB|nr:glyoxylase-like metal-dependent hydrolase (beta-lactamase superfamily II) [Meinhardsimonia xiamenensis]SDK85937.1 Glyoxylase, beta-lactamase superfamily II [Meinhardsimonia xiamenensis]